MKTYRLNDGLVVTAETPTELLEKVWEKSFSPPKTFAQFCVELRHRLEEQTGVRINSTTPEALFQAMVTTGLVEEIEPTGEASQ